MNILREIRRINQRSMPARIIVIFVFSVILIVSTYAWFTMQENINIGGLNAEVTPWDVTYYINDETVENFEETAIFVVDEFYPGMPEHTDIVHIYNMAETPTNIEYEIVSVKIFGEEVLEQLKQNGEIQKVGNTTDIFSTDTQYPFDVSFTYDKDYMTGAFESIETTPESKATFQFYLNWSYEGTDNLDTQFGKNAYTYYQEEGNELTKAIEIRVRITSSMVRED